MITLFGLLKFWAGFGETAAQEDISKTIGILKSPSTNGSIGSIGMTGTITASKTIGRIR